MRAQLVAALAAAPLLLGTPACSPSSAGRRAVLRHPDGATVAFSSDFHLIFVPVRVEGRSRDFLLDTGASRSLLDSAWAESLGLAVVERRLQEQPGGPVELGLVRGLTLELGEGVRVESQELLAAPLAELERLLGRPVGGILGHDLLSQSVVEVDYRARRLRFHAPRSFSSASTDTVLPLRLLGGRAGVRIELGLADGTRVSALPAVDTGSMDFLSFHGAFAHEHPALVEGRTTITFRGYALTGETEATGVAVPLVRLGPHEYRHVATGLVHDEDSPEPLFDGVLGGALLARFTVILDYAGERLVLRPNEDSTEPFLFDLAGLVLLLGGEEHDRVEVHQSFLGSAAARAHVRSGDVLVAVDGRPATELGLPALWAMFHDPAAEGRRHVLVLEREGERIDTAMTLSRHPLIQDSERDDPRG